MPNKTVQSTHTMITLKLRLLIFLKKLEAQVFHLELTGLPFQVQTFPLSLTHHHSDYTWFKLTNHQAWVLELSELLFHIQTNLVSLAHQFNYNCVTILGSNLSTIKPANITLAQTFPASLTQNLKYNISLAQTYLASLSHNLRHKHIPGSNLPSLLVPQLKVRTYPWLKLTQPPCPTA